MRGDQGKDNDGRQPIPKTEPRIPIPPLHYPGPCSQCGLMAHWGKVELGYENEPIGGTPLPFHANMNDPQRYACADKAASAYPKPEEHALETEPPLTFAESPDETYPPEIPPDTPKPPKRRGR